MLEAYSYASLFPPEMSEWRELPHRHRLEMHFPRDQLLAVSLQLVSAGFPLPSNLDDGDLSELHAMASASPFPGAFRAVRSSARAAFAPLSSAGAHLVPAHELFAHDSLVLAIRRHSAQFSVSGQIVVRAKRKLHAPRPFTKMGPAQRVRPLGAPAVLPHEVDRFVKGAAHANLLKQAKAPLPGMASASRCYAAFCELREVAPFPVREEVALQWSSMFNNTATFGNYVSLLEKYCFFLHFPTAWKPPCVRHVAKGLGKFQNKDSASRTSFVSPFS